MRTPIVIDGGRVFDQSHASGGRVHVCQQGIRVVWESRTARFRSRRVQHFGWTILKQAEGVRGLGFVYRGGGGEWQGKFLIRVDDVKMPAICTNKR